MFGFLSKEEKVMNLAVPSTHGILHQSTTRMWKTRSGHIKLGVTSRSSGKKMVFAKNLLNALEQINEFYFDADDVPESAGSGE